MILYSADQGAERREGIRSKAIGDYGTIIPKLKDLIHFQGEKRARGNDRHHRGYC